MFRGLLAEPDCKFCPLRRSTKVPPEGNRNAKIAVVGMGPGWQEEKYGHVFIGESGQLLNRILREAGLNREDLWVSNCALCRPVAIEIDPQESRWMPKAKVEQESILKHCRSRLLRELAVVKPKVIVAVGALTMKALTDDVEGINKIQGSLNRLTKDAGFDAIVIPVFHPAHMLRGEQRFYPTVVQGFRKAKRLAEHGAKPVGRLFIVDPASPTVEKDIDKLEDLVNQILESSEDIAVDVESTVAEPTEATLTIVGFASQTRRLGVAVTVRTWNPATGTFDFTWNAYQWHRVNNCLTRLLAGSNTKWYWNYGFDVTLLERHYRLGGKVRDGMILHHLAEPDLLHGLDFAAQSYLDIPPWKYYFRKAEKAGTGTHRDLLIYNAQDALYTALLAPLLIEAATEIDNIHIEAHQLEMADMARRAHIYGIPIDLEAWRRVYNEHEQLRYAALERMKQAIDGTEGAVDSLNEYIAQRRQARATLAGRDTAPKPTAPLTAESWNPNSGDHGCWFLYEFLRLQAQRWTKGGPDKDPAKQTPSHSYKGVLVYLSNPLVKAYVDRAEEEATLRTLDAIKNHLNPRTGRLHPSWNATGTKGTRWVSKINVQNWDETIKEITVQPPDRCWIGADAAAIEYRVAAVLAGIPELLTLFNQAPFDEEAEEWKKYDPAYDAHSLVATEVFGDVYTNGDKKTKKALRTMVKRVVYALFYGAFPKKIYGTILEDSRVPSEFRAMITLERIERIWEGFSARFGEWEAWADNETATARATGFQSWPPFNRKHPWAMPETIEETKIRNTPIQRAAGDVVNLLFKNMDREVRSRNLDAHFTLHAHDACLWDCALEHRDVMLELVNRHFDYQLQAPSGHRVHIYGQAKAGRTLAEV